LSSSVPLSLYHRRVRDNGDGKDLEEILSKRKKRSWRGKGNEKEGENYCFFNYTVQRGRSQHARTLTPMNTRTFVALQIANRGWNHFFVYLSRGTCFFTPFVDVSFELCNFWLCTSSYVDARFNYPISKKNEYTYANPTPMSTSEGLSTGLPGDSRSHNWRLVVVDGNVAYHLTSTMVHPQWCIHGKISG
jgi:hypothetical protein